MAHDWLGDLYRRWGRTPTQRTRRRIDVERLEARDVPTVDPLFALLPDPAPTPPLTGANGFQPGPDLKVSPTEVMVSVSGADPSLVFQGLLARPDATGLDSANSGVVLVNGPTGIFQVGLTAGKDPQATIDWLSGLPGVQWATPNYYTTIDPYAFTPNDPLFTTAQNGAAPDGQWHLKKIQAEKAWDVTTGSNKVIVAVTDSGLDITHPDIQSALWVNPSPTNGDVNGITSYLNPVDPGYGNVSPSGDHGTHVAGTIGAQTNNAVGVAGVAGGKTGGDGTRLMPIRYLSPTGLYFSAVAKAMVYATDHGAKIVNSSIVTHMFIDGAGTQDPVMQAAFDYMYDKGVLHMIAAANDNSKNTTVNGWTHGVVVAATDHNDRKASFSNYGYGVDIAAPGTEIWATTVGGYGSLDGTSMATPVTSGVAALIWAAHPTWTRDQVVAQLLGTADFDALYKVNTTFIDQLGSGRVNAYRAVTETLAAPKFGTITGIPANNGSQPVVNSIGIRTPLRLDPATVKDTAFELRGAGTDKVFGTTDDVLVPMILNAGQKDGGGLQYRIGNNALNFTFPALGPGQYRFTAFANKLADPFGNKLDGDADGNAGGDFIRVFTAAPALSGTVFEDYNGTGVVDTNSVGAGGFTAFLDINGNGTRESSEPAAVSGAGGRYAFATVAPGVYTLRVDVPGGWLATSKTAYDISYNVGDTQAGFNFGIHRPNAVYGTVFNDFDGNGVRASTEPGLPGFTITADSDADGVYTPPTKTVTVSNANPSTVNVPNNGSAGSSVAVTDAFGKIANVIVQVTADSTFQGSPVLFNMTLSLIGPDGTRVILGTDLELGDRMVNTVFDGTVSRSIRTGFGNLTGTYRPVGDLSVFNGLSPLGNWTLVATDHQLNGAEPYGGDSITTIRGWTLRLVTTDGDQQVITGPSGGYRFDLPPGGFGVNLTRQAGFKLSAPGQYTNNVTITGGQAGAVLPFGLVRDVIAPRILSISPAGLAITNSPTVAYNVRFTEPVEGLTPSNFKLDASGFGGPVTITGMTQTGPATYTVTVDTPGQFGTVGLDLPSGGGLTDFALNPLFGVPLNGDRVTVDTLPPTSTLDLPPGPSGKNVYTSAGWSGSLVGTATDAETGIAEVLVVVQQDATGLYFDGTSFSSAVPLPVPAKLNGGNWTLPLSTAVLAEGPYTITQQVTDFAGNPQLSGNTAVFGIDNGPPTVGISPTGGVLVNTNPIPFLFTFSESVTGLDPSDMTVTGGTLLGITGSGASYIANVRPDGSGPVSIALVAAAVVDFAGNTSGPAGGTVTFDGTAPTVTVPPGVDGQAVTSANFAGVITGTASDDRSGVAKVQVAVRRRVNGVDVYFDGTGFTASAPVYLDAAGLTNWSFGFPASSFPADDAYQFLVRVTDQAGNLTVKPVNVTIDNAAPNPAVTTPASMALLNAANFEAAGKRVSGTATDATSGPATTQVAVRRTADGFYFDGNGFVSSTNPVFLTAGGNAAAWTLPSLTSDRLVDGQYQVTARTTDRAGNVGTTASTFTYDNTAPQPVGLTPTNGLGYNASRWPGALTGQVVDTVDTNGVQVTLRRDADGTFWNGSFFGSPTPVMLTATVSRPVPSGPAVFNYPFSAFGFPAEGRYTLAAIATDKASNQGTTLSSFTFDNTNPTSTVSPVGSGETFSPSTFPGRLTGTATDTLSGVGLVQVSLRQVSTGRYFDGAGFTASAEAKLAATVSTPNGLNTGWTFDLSAGSLPTDGKYLVNAYATDVAGNVQPFGTPYTFTFDATAPQAVVQADKGAVTNVAPLTFTVGFSSPVSDLDPTGLAVTNGSVLDVTRRSDSTFVVRVTPAGDGAVTLSVLPTAARDAAGNPTLPAGPAIGQFDRTPPTVALTAPTGVVPLGDPVVVTAIFNEPVVGFGAASLRATNATILGVTGSGAIYQVQLLPNGPGAVGLSIADGAFADLAGNLGSASVTLSRSAEDPRYAVSVGSVVRTYDNRNGLRGQAAPFGDNFTGGIRVTSADFNGDGIPDVVAGTGPGVATRVVVLDGRTFSTLIDLSPFEESFTGGVFVTAGDVTGDGVAELVISPDTGGGPRVRVFDGASFAQLADFYGIADPNFRGGARAAVGDVTGDGLGELIVAAGFGGGPRVAVFDGRSVSQGEGNLQRVVSDFYAYEDTLRNGVYVSAGDLDGDGRAELVTAGGPGGGPRVTSFSGSELATGRLVRTADFFAGNPDSRDGVRVAVKRMQTNQPADLIVGGGATNTLAVYTAASLRQTSPVADFQQDLLPGVTGSGVFVG